MGRIDGSGRECLILKFKNNYWRAQKRAATFFEISRSGRFINLIEKEQKSIRIKKRSPGSAIMPIWNSNQRQK